MATTFTLDSIREAADKKYGAIEVPVSDGKAPVEIVNPLRLKKEQREALSNLDAKDSDDVLDYFLAAWEILASKASAARLAKEFDGDVALHATLFRMVSQGAEVGEASPSQD